jgi:hypothetical protein
MSMAHRFARRALMLVATAALTPHAAAAELAWFDGRPSFSEGADRGYYVWRDGDKWSVRWTTQGAERRFTGNVTAVGGELTSLKRIDVDEERKVVAAGRPARVVRGPRGRVHVRPGRGPVVAERDEDRIDKDGDRRIHWSAKTDADIDGFDFKVKGDVQSLRFVLEIDGQSRAADVEFGRANRRPANNPFSVELR